MNNTKKGLFARLSGKNKGKKESCCSCCNIQLEEISEEADNANEKETKNEGKGKTCCK